MDMKAKGMAVAIAITMSTTSTFAFTPIGNNSSKGSLLVYQRIDVADGNDTLITLTNDSSAAVRLKCYYATSDDLGTPYSGTAADARRFKRYTDFTIDLTHNQPVSWWASTGQPDDTNRPGVAPPFGFWASDGTTATKTGELMCWAVSDAMSTQKHYNHLFGTASVLNWQTGQAYEYTATSFQAMGPSTMTGQDFGAPGAINLDNIQYDACPNILLGNFSPGGRPFDVAVGDQGPHTKVTLASCNQDLRQSYTPTITKLTWTFWNRDERQATGTHTCADSWFETDFPQTMLSAQYIMLGTEAAYFRIETTADTQICGPSATSNAYTGIITQSYGAGVLRSTNLTGRGVAAPAVIRWDPAPADSYKK